MEPRAWAAPGRDAALHRVRLLLAEQTNAQIAEALFISESTIKFHVHNFLQKTGCKTRQELVRKYHLILFLLIDQQSSALPKDTIQEN